MFYLKLWAILAVTMVIVDASSSMKKKFEGVSITLSPSRASLQKPHLEYSCLISNLKPEITKYNVAFFIDSSHDITGLEVFLFKQHGSDCSKPYNHNIGHYYGRCGEGTNDMYKSYKRYILTIDYVTPIDVESYVTCCITEICGTTSNKVGVLPIIMNLTMTNSTNYIREGSKVTLSCSMFPALNIYGKIKFERDSVVLGVIEQTRTKCFPLTENSATNYRFICGPGTQSNTTVTKVYYLVIKEMKNWDYQFVTCKNDDFDFISDRLHLEKKRCNLMCISGTLKLKDDICFCDCKKHMTGTLCNKCDDRCVYGKTDSFSCRCICQNDSAGSYCEKCNLQCVHGSIPNTTCACDCEDDWSGKLCDQCAIKCANDGIVLPESCTCDCTERWIGTKCEECKLECINGVLDEGNCSCICDYNWIGEMCDTCDLICEFGGNFQNESCMCKCDSHWYGDRCDKCDLDCKHGEYQKDYCMCNCYLNWDGDECDTCLLNCVHGNITNGCECACHENWLGSVCDVKGTLAFGAIEGSALAVIAGIICVTILFGVLWSRRRSKQREIEKYNWNKQMDYENPAFAN